MKTIVKIFILGLLLFPMCAYAQKATDQKEYEIRAEWEDMQGYSEKVYYKVPIYYDEDDNVVKHGPLKINHKSDLTSRVRQKCVLAYTVSGNYVNGKLDGALTVEKSATVSAGVLKVKGTLNFVKGVPTGTWTFVESVTEGGKTKSAKHVVVIKDTSIVSCNINDGRECFTINADNTFSGKLQGVVYKNGVNTSEFIRKTGERTKPDETAQSLINAFIAGTMSESDIIAKGFGLQRRYLWVTDFDWENLEYYFSKLDIYHYTQNAVAVSPSSLIYQVQNNRSLSPAYTLQRVEVKSPEEMVSIANTVKTAAIVNAGTDQITWYENRDRRTWHSYYYGMNQIDVSRNIYYFTDEAKLKFEETLAAALVEREELINKKISEDCVNYIKKSFDTYRTLSDYESQSSAYGSDFFVVKNKSIFPIISYEILGVEKSDDPNVALVVKARVNVGVEQELTLRDVFASSTKSKPSSYVTYDVVVRARYDDGHVYAYLDEDYVRIKNDYDVIKELDVKIEENENLIKELGKTTFKSNYNAYKAYAKERTLSVNDNDLKSSIKEREDAIAVQEAVLKFVDMTEQIQKGDTDVASKCTDPNVVKAYSAYAKTRDLSWSLNWSQEKLEGYMAVQENTIKFDGLLGQIRGTDADITAKLSDKKDMLKAYSTYVKARDLSWSPDWSQEKIDGYLSVQKKCLEFNALRDCINNNNTKINSYKSSAPTIVKAYTAYVSTCDLSWNPDVDFAAANSLIEIQERCMAALNKQDVSDVDKSIKKQKMTNLLEILDVL